MDIIIVGGGASGVLCAIEASKNIDNKVILIEKNDKLLKKVLLSGNGKCNFTSSGFPLDINDKYDKFAFNKIYDNDFYKTIYKKFDNNMLIKYFDDLGIKYRTLVKNAITYYYPMSNDSKSISYALQDKLNNNKNIKVYYNLEVNDFLYKENKFIVSVSDKKFKSDILIFATGGKSYPKTGSDGKIFDILNNHNIQINKLLPALTALKFNNKILVKNMRINAIVKLFVDDKLLDISYGEVQFTNEFISGVPILELSSKAVKSIDNKHKVNLKLDLTYDLFPYEYSNKFNEIKNKILYQNYFNNDLFFMKEKVYDILKKRVAQIPYRDIKYFFSSIFDDDFGYYLIKKNISNTNNKLICDISQAELNNMIDNIINFNIEISDYKGFEYAQVTQGGINTDNINKNNFEYKTIKNLHFIGEMLDISGICGGYNLQFAFSSGFILGEYLKNKNDTH